MSKRRYFNFWLLLAIAATVISLSGCRSVRTVTVEKPVIIHDTTSVVKEVHDSTIVEREKVVEVKGDTVFVTQTEKTHREVAKKDTVHEVVEVPVEVKVPEPYPVEVEVEKDLSWLQRTLIYIGILYIVVIVIRVGWRWLKRSK